MTITQIKRTIKLLRKLANLNLKSATIYKLAAKEEKRLLLSRYYIVLYHEKIKNYEELIKNMMNLIQLLPNYTGGEIQKEYKLSSFKLKYRKLFYLAYTREIKALFFYRKYLSRINNSELRELMLNHIYKVKTNIQEMNQKGVNKYKI